MGNLCGLSSCCCFPVQLSRNASIWIVLLLLLSCPAVSQCINVDCLAVAAVLSACLAMHQCGLSSCVAFLLSGCLAMHQCGLSSCCCCPVRLSCNASMLIVQLHCFPALRLSWNASMWIVQLLLLSCPAVPQFMNVDCPAALLP